MTMVVELVDKGINPGELANILDVEQGIVHSWLIDGTGPVDQDTRDAVKRLHSRFTASGASWAFLNGSLGLTSSDGKASYLILEGMLRSVVEGHPYPGEPADVDMEERQELWHSHAQANGLWDIAMEVAERRRHFLIRSTDMVFMAASASSLLATIIALVFQPSGWGWGWVWVFGGTVFVPTVFTIFSLIVIGGKMDRISSLLTGAKSVKTWHARLPDAMTSIVGSIPPLLMTLTRALDASNPQSTENAKCMERHLSVSDQVAMMRVTKRIRAIVDQWFGGDQINFQLDGDTREVYCRALDAIGQDTSMADRQTHAAHHALSDVSPEAMVGSVSSVLPHTMTSMREVGHLHGAIGSSGQHVAENSR